MDGWSVTQWMIVYKGRLLKIIFKLKIKDHPDCHYMAFKHSISFVTNLAANFGYNSNLTHYLSRSSFLGQVIDLDLLLCTEFDSEYAALSESNEWSKDGAKQWELAAQLWSATTSCWLLTQFGQFHRKFHFSYEKKKVLVAAWYPQIIKTLSVSREC